MTRRRGSGLCEEPLTKVRIVGTASSKRQCRNPARESVVAKFGTFRRETCYMHAKRYIEQPTVFEVKRIQ